MELYTLFISYRHGGHYCGVYPLLSHLRDVIKEMASDMEIPGKEVPSLELIKLKLQKGDDMWHEFSDTTWVHIQETSKPLVEEINRRCAPSLTKKEYLYLENKNIDSLVVSGDYGKVHGTWVVEGGDLPVSVVNAEKKKEFLISFEHIPENWPSTTCVIEPYSEENVRAIVENVLLSWNVVVFHMPSEDTRFGKDIARIKAEMEKEE